MSELDRKLNELGVDRIAISPYKQWTRGYMEPGNIGNGYVTGIKVDAGVRDKSDDDGSFPKAFAKVSKKGVPAVSIVVATVIIEIVIVKAAIQLIINQLYSSLI